MLKKFIVVLASLATLAPSFVGAGTPYIGGALSLQFIGDYIGIMPNWFAGYGTALGCTSIYYLGAEIFADYPSGPISGNQVNRILYDGGITALGGIYIGPYYMIYAKLGVQASRVKLNDASSTGGLLGLGLQMALSEYWDARAEYVYVGQGIFNGFGSQRANNARIGLVYKFY